MIRLSDGTRVVIFSASFNESRRFYEEFLNLRIVKERNHGIGKSGVVYAIGDLLLEILEGPNQPPADNFYIYIKVESVDELWNGLSGKVDVADTIQTQPWGHRNFSIRDPNGYKLKFFNERV